MYDEFERAMTGRTSRMGMGPLGWTLAIGGFLFTVGIVGVGFAINRAAHEVRGMAHEFALDANRAGGLVGLATLADVEAHARLLAMDPEEGLDFLAGMEPGDPAVAFAGEMMPGTWDLADLDPSDRGEGRSMVINAGGEELRFDLERSDAGGSLSIVSGEGNVRFDLTREGEGGRLVIRTDDETVRLGVGEGAEGVPVWVPTLGMPERPRPVYSLDSPQGALGAVTWEADAAPSEVLAFYREQLEGAGYEMKDRYRRTDAGTDEGSFWARNEAQGRTVFVVAHGHGTGTQLLVGYGEKR